MPTVPPLNRPQIAAQLQETARSLDRAFLDKQEIIRLMVISVIAGEHMVLVGPPGTAKSALVRGFAKLVDARYFEYLLTRFTEPNELFGPVDMMAFRQGEYRRRVEGMLPEAEIVFLDEVFKANSAILNSLLTLLNERQYANGRNVLSCPLLSVFGASNEVPNDDNLHAIFDRFLLRALSNNLDSYHFQNLVQRGVAHEIAALAGGRRDQAAILSASALHGIHHGFADLMRFSDEFITTYKGLIFQIRSEGISVSDRRVVKLTKLFAASALFDGRATACDADFFVLKHIWNNLDQAEILAEIVSPVIDRYYREHPEERRFVGPTAGLDELLAELSMIRDLLTSGQDMSDVQLFSQLKNLNEIKGALLAIDNETARRMVSQVDQLLDSVFFFLEVRLGVRQVPVPQDMRRSFLARQLGTLALSPVAPDNAMGLVRAAAWHNTMLRLGLRLPLFVTHDLGLVLSRAGQLDVDAVMERRLPGLDENTLRGYAAMLEQVAESDLAEAVAAWRLRDDLMAVLLSKLLVELQQRWRGNRQWVGSVELPLDPGIYLNVDPTVHYRDFDASPPLSLLAHLVREQLFLLTAVEQVDLDTLRLLGLFHDGQSFGGVMDIADLLSIFSSPEANGVVNFSMELLPSVLETRRQSGVQTFSIDGYASIERHGSIDSIVLSEFAYDDDIFVQKVIDNELYFYGHEKQRLEERSLHYILVDSSASMRGERDVFARGLALTLCKKLTLQGNEVWLRFFDSRLYDILRISSNSEAAVPHLLCFRSERGRNYGRVFRQLLSELQRLRRHEDRQLLVYVITHGQCHIGVDVVQQLAQIAHLYGVFILPSSNLHLDYLSVMHRYQIVDEEVLSSRERSVDRALEIVDDAADEETQGAYAARPERDVGSA